MHAKPDKNSQVSGSTDAKIPIPAEAVTHDGAVEPAPADPAPDLSVLLRKAEDEAAALKDAWLRAKAETDNVRKQALNDVTRTHKYAIERFAQELLTVKDALEFALATPGATIEGLKDGVDLTLKNLKAAFDKAQIQEIDPLNEKYDPHRHQAMTMLESDQTPGTVVQVFQKGYLLNDRVLRPALVAVAKAREGAASGSAGA
jgi:molecular chaperone GrpE